MNRTVLSCLGLGLAASAMAGSHGLAIPFVAGLSGNVAGNLATDLFKILDRRVAERFLDGWRGLDENHLVAQDLRLAQINALRSILNDFEESQQHDFDLDRKAEFERFAGNLRSFLKAADRSSALPHPGATADLTPSVKAAAVRGLPDLLDVGLVARRTDADVGPLPDKLLAVRQTVEAAVLVEVAFEAGVTFDEIPSPFIVLFRGDDTVDGWFGRFIRDAAAKIKANPELERIWNAEQVALVKAVIAAQAEVLRSLDVRTAQIAEEQRRGTAILERTASKVGEIWQEMVGQLSLVDGYEAVDPAHIRRLPTLLLVPELGVIPYDDSRGLKSDLLAWLEDEASGQVAGRLYAAGGGSGKTRLVLDAIEALRSSNWAAGLVGREALETRSVLGVPDAEQRLARLFADPKYAGIFLAIDYAERRQQHVELVTRVALQRRWGRPIRVVLLARTADAWWSRLTGDSQQVQRVFDTIVPSRTALDIPVNVRSAFFDRAKASFSQKLSGLRDDDGPLVSADWRATPLPRSRRREDAPATPLILAMEAYLAVRGIVSSPSLLADMAREERRHWARALRRPSRSPSAIADPEVDCLNRCVVALSLVGELLLGAYPEEALEPLIAASLPEHDVPGEGAVAKAAVVARLGQALLSLYTYPAEGGVKARGVQPDLVGEQVCASLGLELADLSVSLATWRPQAVPEIIGVLDRACRPVHGEDQVEAAHHAVAKVASAAIGRHASVIVEAALISSGGLLEELELLAENLAHEDRDALYSALPHRSGRLAGLTAKVAVARAEDPYGRTVATNDKFTLLETSANELAERARREIQAALRLIDTGQFDRAIKIAESALVSARWLRRLEEGPGSRDVVGALRTLGLATCASGAFQAGEVYLNQAAELGETIYAKDRDDGILFELSSVYHNLAKSKSERGRLKSAMYFGKKSVWQRRQLISRSDEHLYDYINSLTNLLRYLSDRGQYADVKQEVSEGIAQIRRLYRQAPRDHAENFIHLAIAIGQRLVELSEFAAAVDILSEAKPITEELAEANLRHFARDLFGVAYFLSQALSATGDVQSALQVLGENIALAVRNIKMPGMAEHVGVLASGARDVLERHPEHGTLQQFIEPYGLRLQ